MLIGRSIGDLLSLEREIFIAEMLWQMEEWILVWSPRRLTVTPYPSLCESFFKKLNFSFWDKGAFPCSSCVPFTQFPPIIIFCKTIASWPRVAWIRSPHRWVPSQESPPFALSWLHFLTSGSQSSVLHFWDFVISRMLPTWIRTVCNLLGFVFFTQYNFSHDPSALCVY